MDSNGGIPNVINNTIVANNGSGLFWGSPSGRWSGPSRSFAITSSPTMPGAWTSGGHAANPNIEFNCVYGNQVQGQPGDYRGLAGPSGPTATFHESQD